MSQTFDPYHKWLGIRPEEQPANHYRLLGLHDFEDDPAAIENAADQRMAYLRTVQTGQHAQWSQKLLNEVVSAKICLLDRDQKTAYDAKLRQRFVSGSERKKPPVVAGPVTARPVRAQADAGTPVQPNIATAARRRSGAVGRVPTAVILGAATAVAFGCVLVALTAVQLWKSTARHEGGPVARTNRLPPPGVVEPANPAPVRPGDTAPQAGETANVLPPDGSELVETATNPQQPDGEPDGPLPLHDPERPTRGEVNPNPADIPATSRNPIDRTESSETRTATAAAPAVPVATRLPVPGPESQREITAQIDELYPPSSFATSTKQLELAREFLRLGEEARDRVDERFVLYRRAMELACEGGNAPLMTTAIDAIGADYDVDPRDVQFKMLQRFVGSGEDPVRVLAFLRSATELVSDAMVLGEFQTALDVSAAACRFCDRPVGSSEFRQSIRDDHVRIERTCGEYERFERAREKLATTPDDPDANLAVGRWYCFVRNDWDQGLACLACGKDESLRAVAAQELSVSPDVVDSVIGLAEAWWELAQSRAGDEQLALARRALFWYHRIAPSALSGIKKLAVEKRRGEIADQLAKRKPSLWQVADHRAHVEGNLAGQKEDAPPDEFAETFSRGVNAALREYDFDAAERWFGRCAKMQPGHVPSLNNYALASVRGRDYRRAIHLWEQAVELAPQTPAVRHNLELLRRMGDDDAFQLEPSLSRSLGQLCTKVNSGGGFRSGVGWLYLPLQGDVRSHYVDNRCMVCGGKGEVDCPVRDCARGTVRGTRADVVGRNPVSGHTIVKNTPIRVPCGNCRGRGKVDCSHCTGGRVQPQH